MCKFCRPNDFDVCSASSVQQIRARANRTLTKGVQIDMSTEECKKYLRRHVNSKTKIVIMFTDINGSTEMSFSLPDEKFAALIRIVAQETSIAISGYGGYVFNMKRTRLFHYFQQNMIKYRLAKTPWIAQEPFLLLRFQKISRYKHVIRETIMTNSCFNKSFLKPLNISKTS